MPNIYCSLELFHAKKKELRRGKISGKNGNEKQLLLLKIFVFSQLSNEISISKLRKFF